MRLELLFSICLLTLPIGGCATQPMELANARPVPPSQLLPGYAAYAKPAENTGTVTVVRDSGFQASAGMAKLFIDGMPVAEFWSGQRLDLSLKPGDHILAISSVPEFIARIRESALSVGPNRTYFYRISAGAEGYELQPTALLN